MEDGETEKTYLTGECTALMDENYIDLMDNPYMQNKQDLCQVMTNLSNKTTEKDKEHFSAVNCSTCLEEHSHDIADCNDDHPSSSENSLPLSSVSQVFTSALLNTSKNEAFCDLKMFFEKECAVFPSIDTNTSKDNSIVNDTDTSTTRPPSTSRECFGTIVSCREQLKHINHTLEESDIDSDESLEPNKKIPKLNDNCKDTKYVEMRRKNNYASQRSRQTKKQREKEMEEKAMTLEKENESLRIKEKKLEELVEKLREMLFNSVNKRK